jgi:peptidoglycan/LPS O-acetylase OafA/YrhL
MNNRIIGLDFLRGIAVILVFFRHHYFFDFTRKMGWIGVDLFFVLSGYLVSNILFIELKKHKNIKPGLFLIRRGFKIYPVFYFFIAITIFYKMLIGKKIPLNEVLGDIFFLQNYVGRLWGHTWSLAIEEHFYFLLAFIFYLFINKSTFNFNKYFVKTVIAIMLIIFITRIFQNYYYPSYYNFSYSHLRFDSLFSGVLVSYFINFKELQLRALIEKYSSVLIFVAALPLTFTPFFDPDNSYLINTFGVTILYFSFSSLLLLFLYNKNINVFFAHNYNNIIIRVITTIGFYSYSIYLFHLMGESIVSRYLRPMLNLDIKVSFLLFSIISIFMGIIVSKLVEIPFLKIRDKYYAKRY